MTNYNQLSPAEAERLALLAEECAEVIQVVGKILRHGYESFHPNNPAITNRDLLAKELGHVLNTVNMMSAAGDTYHADIIKACVAKKQSIGPFLHHQATGAESENPS